MQRTLKRALVGWINAAGLLMIASSLAARAEKAGSTLPTEAASPGIPIHFTLDKPGYVTLVIDDAKGNRVCNLLAETYLPAGQQTVTWDGYDIGDPDDKGEVRRHRVPPGTYYARGLVHDRITMRYEFSVNSPGTPPWKTKDGSGAWLADHSPPADVKFLPAGSGSPYRHGEAQLLVCSTSGESGDEFVWLNAAGRRLFGLNTGFWGGTHLCVDRGKNAVPDTYAYVFMSGERDPDNNEIEVRAFKKSGQIETVGKITFPMEWKKMILPPFKSDAEAYGTNGIAAYNGLIVFSFTRQNKLIFLDARQRKVLGEVPLTSPRDLLFDLEGRLYVLTGKQVRRFHVSPGVARLEGEQTVVSNGLEEPHRMTQDAAGNLYIADWGASQQIKVFTPDGKLLRTIGKPGGPQLGLYDEHKLSYPCGMTVDDQGRLWVAEAESYPKRLSLWKTDGTLLQAWYGGPKYGGGGAIDPQDKSRFFYAEYERGGGTEFALDWEQGTYRPEAVYWRGTMPNVEPMPGPAPERVITVGGYTYLTNCYNGQLRYNQDRGIGIWRLGKDHIARPVVIIGNAADLVNSIWGWPMLHKEAITALWKNEDPAHVMFVWCDRNGDQIAEPNEIQYVVTTRKDANGNLLDDMGLQPMVQPDLSITTSYGTWIAPPKMDARGTPIYDLTKQQIVGNPDWQRSPVIAAYWTLSNQDGVPAWMGADLQGQRRWKYLFTPEKHLGGPGLMVAPTRLLGPPVQPRVGQASAFVAISGEMGTVFLMTMDGLFLQTLGGDSRFTPLWRMPEHERGMLIEGVTFAQEHFHPTITQTADGTIYMVCGHEHSSIVRLDGLESVQRRDFGTVQATEQTLAGLPTEQTEAQPEQGRPTLTVTLRDQGVRVDGDLADWPADTQWAQLDVRASGAVLLTHDRLYAAFKTGNLNALANAGSDPTNLFKYGGALDLMIGPGANKDRTEPMAGDLRLLVTRVKGQTKALLYRAVVPGTAPERRTLFASPVGKVFFDAVADVSDKVELGQSGGDFELSVLLSVLGLVPQSGQKWLGDIGLLRGDGAQTTQRVYWANRNTLIVSDIPSEARLQPAQWGFWKIK
jgi:hypothetical protein